MREPRENHWNIDGVDYASKTTLKKELGITDKEWHDIIVKAYKERLELRQKSMHQSRYGNEFTAWSAEDVERLLGLIQSQPVT